MGEERGMEEFDYFMVRVRRTAAGKRDGSLAGVAERLGTGEKWAFESSDELVRVVGGKQGHNPNMLRTAMSDKQLDP
jgi:hypothetical protein